VRLTHQQHVGAWLEWHQVRFEPQLALGLFRIVGFIGGQNRQLLVRYPCWGETVLQTECRLDDDAQEPIALGSFPEGQTGWKELRVLDPHPLHDHHDNHDAYDAGHDVQEGIAVDRLGLLCNGTWH